MHGRRAGYYVIGEGILADPPNLFGPPAAGAPLAPPLQVPALRFGRLFGRAPTGRPPFPVAHPARLFAAHRG